MAGASKQVPFTLMGETIRPGETRTLSPQIGRLLGHDAVTMPITVVHGRKPGPRLLLTAAIHGDELNGIEIIRRVLNARWIRPLHGTVVAIPMVNIFGVLQRSRYLPDRRDLNRSFPGSEKGSLAARMAHLLTHHILPGVDVAIDLHTGAVHRSNLPQIRVHLENERAAAMAKAFGAPVMLNAEIRDGSLRGAGDDLGIAIITYEAGEALRFDETAILAGVQGVRNVMTDLGMIRRRTHKPAIEPALAHSSTWVRAPADGFFRPLVQLGDRVRKGDVIGYVSGPLESTGEPVVAAATGLVIGMNNLPQVYEGEALYHIARFESVRNAEQTVDTFHAQLEEPSLDD